MGERLLATGESSLEVVLVAPPSRAVVKGHQLAPCPSLEAAPGLVAVVFWHMVLAVSYEVRPLSKLLVLASVGLCQMGGV